MAQYLLLVWGPSGADEFDGYGSAEARAESWRATGVFNDRLRAEGRVVYVNGLADASRSAVVDATGSSPLVTDGPYVESKEYIAGLWIITAADRSEALALATEASRACGRPIEVRPAHDA